MDANKKTDVMKNFVSDMIREQSVSDSDDCALRCGATISVAQYGATGDADFDATAAITQALVDWCNSGGRLEFGPGTHKITSPIIIDLDGVDVGEIIMFGAISPNPGIGRAITFKNSRGGFFKLKVAGGGRTADYTQADPVGGDEAFTFLNAYGSAIEVVGQNYAGRVLRITSGIVGSGGFKTQWIDLRSVYCNSSAPINADEATRLSQGVGQAFFIDSGTNAFGRIRHAFKSWELYGSIIENTTDVTFDDAETIYRGNTGMQLRGVISFWGGTLKLGSEKAGWNADLLSIKSSSIRNSQNVNIKTIFAVGGYNGVVAAEVGVAPGHGLSIDSIVTRLNTGCGIILDNCRKIRVLNAQCYADNVSLHLRGAVNFGQICINSIQSKLQAIVVDSEVNGQIVFSGSAANGNANNVEGISLIDIGTTAPFIFENFIASSGNVDYLYDLPSGNLTRIMGGQVIKSGSTAVFLNQPNRADSVIGWQTANKGTAVIPSGSASVAVSHGLAKVPDLILLTARSAGGAGAYTTGRTATQFTITLVAAVSGDMSIDWEAKANYSD